MLGMLVFPDLGEGVSLLWWWALVVSERASVSCYRPSIYKAVRHLLPCYRSFEVKFWFPQFLGTGTPMEWAFVVSDGVSVTSYGPHYKALLVCYGFCAVFNLIF